MSSRAAPLPEIAAAMRTLESMKTLSFRLSSADTVEPLDQLTPLVPTRLDQFLKGQSLLPERFANSVQRLRRDHFLWRNEDSVGRLNDCHEVALLQSESTPHVAR